MYMYIYVTQFEALIACSINCKYIVNTGEMMTTLLAYKCTSMCNVIKVHLSPKEG